MEEAHIDDSMDETWKGSAIWPGEGKWEEKFSSTGNNMERKPKVKKNLVIQRI
jgi:hypothetical protein